MCVGKAKQKSIPKSFRKLSVEERLVLLKKHGFIQDHIQAQCELLPQDADRMIENVVGVMGLPQAVVPNMLINDRLYHLPLVIEEPSVVIALNYTALLIARTDGFKAQMSQSLITGQIQLINVKDKEKAVTNLIKNKNHLIEKANILMPRMVERGGGVRDIAWKSYDDMMVVELFIDTCDAMGANHINTVCEAIAPEIEVIIDGTALLKIVSNLTDQSLVKANISLPSALLATKEFSGEEVRDRIVMANKFALLDTHRATTHNKGIMNGIDALLIATGNDWRAVEASIHAYASRDRQYKALTDWFVGGSGDLVGEMELPLKLGIVGDSLKANPIVETNLNLLGVESASELSQVAACVGLAQNFAALRSLVTTGIQHGHMKYNARCIDLSNKE